VVVVVEGSWVSTEWDAVWNSRTVAKSLLGVMSSNDWIVEVEIRVVEGIVFLLVIV